MQWNLRLTHPSIQHIQTDRPPQLFAFVWLIGLFLACGCAGAAGAIGVVPTSVLALGAIAIIAIVWLATYSWVGDAQQTAADWLMVLVGIVGAGIGVSVTTFLDPRATTDGSWLLIGILPITGAFRGTASLIIWSQSRSGEGSDSKLLKSLPLVLLTSIGIAILGFWWSMTAGWGKSIAVLTIGLAMALPLGIYFFLAYSLLPSLFIDGIDRFLKQLPNFIDADGNPIQPSANLPDLTPETPIADRPERNDNRSQFSNFSLDEWAKSPQLKAQFLFCIPLVLIPLLLSSAIYWAIVCGVGGFIVGAIEAIGQISIPVDWGWDWLKAWAFTWLFALALAIVKIFQNPLQWMSLFQTTSILSQSLLMPTAIIWGGFTGMGALVGVAWSGSLGTILSAAAWGLRRSFKTKHIFCLLSAVAVAGTLCGWAIVKHKML
ncbi:hypothetical protein [Chamaesiphon minutus]|nr:hypothetical protein [Chamaesiphon minutus]